MEIKHIKTAVFFAASLLWVGGLQAQTSINSAGGNNSNSSGSASYSFGQVFHAVENNSSGSIEEGVQHAYIIETSSLDQQDFNISLTAYPNPTADYLTVKINSEMKQGLKFNLVNVHGEEVTRGEIESNGTQINMVGLAPGIYFMDVLNVENQQIKNFKIIKK